MEIFITINGIQMTKAEYKEYKKDKEKAMFDKLPKYKQRAILAEKKAEKKRKESEIKIIANGVEAMVTKVGVMKSLSAYYKHGYRQWGLIAREIINDPKIRVPFEKFYLKQVEIERCVCEMQSFAKRSSKDIFERIEKLSYLLDDAKYIMENLRAAVGSSGVINRYMAHECISGEGKRLGLRTLMSRTFSAIKEMEKLIREFAVIARNGIM